MEIWLLEINRESGSQTIVHAMRHTPYGFWGQNKGRHIGSWNNLEKYRVLTLVQVCCGCKV